MGRDPATNARCDAHGDVLVYGKERGRYTGVLLDDVKLVVAGGIRLQPGHTVVVSPAQMGNTREANVEERLRGVELARARLDAN